MSVLETAQLMSLCARLRTALDVGGRAQINPFCAPQIVLTDAVASTQIGSVCSYLEFRAVRDPGHGRAGGCPGRMFMHHL